MKHHPSWTALRSYVITAGLACLMGVSYELFVFPNAFAPAGINGLATMLQYLLHVNIGYLCSSTCRWSCWPGKKSTGTSPAKHWCSCWCSPPSRWCWARWT